MRVLDYYGNEVEVHAVIAEYYNGNTAIRLYTKDGEPWATLTVNFEHKLPDKNLAFIDTNNFPEAENFIKKYGLGFKIGDRRSGYCVYPLYQLDLNKLRGKKK